jgi:hypothetical protein
MRTGSPELQFCFISHGIEAQRLLPPHRIVRDALSWSACMTPSAPHSSANGLTVTPSAPPRHADCRVTAGAAAAIMSAPVNSSFAAPNGVALSGIRAASHSPACSAKGRRYRANVRSLPSESVCRYITANNTLDRS